MQTSLDMFHDTSQMSEYFRRPLNFFFIYPDSIDDIEPKRVRKHPRRQEQDTMNIEPPIDDIKEATNNSFDVSVESTPYIAENNVEYVELEFILEGTRIQPKRNWSAYNRAQRDEGELFDVLLSELLENLPMPERKRGRPELPLPDLIFCAVKKVHSNLSSRRAYSMYANAEIDGEISHAPHYNAISKFLLKEGVSEVLHELIRDSALPLASIEKDFAIDSSGFSTSSFSAYHGIKHKVDKTHNWVKAHICSGVNSNIVTDVVITDGHGADCKQFESLVNGTAIGFDIEEVSADKAYLSRDNYRLVEEIGAQAYIPFKKNTTARSGRCGHSKTWKRMFHHFQLHREEFDEHYHKRSNVESTFGAIKMKFGEHLKSRNYTAQKNELLCKILAYNITILIHEMYESGIEPDF